MPEARCTVANTHPKPSPCSMWKLARWALWWPTHAAMPRHKPLLHLTLTTQLVSMLSQWPLAAGTLKGRCATSARLYSTRNGRDNPGQASIAAPEPVWRECSSQGATGAICILQQCRRSTTTETRSRSSGTHARALLAQLDIKTLELAE